MSLLSQESHRTEYGQSCLCNSIAVSLTKQLQETGLPTSAHTLVHLISIYTCAIHYHIILYCNRPY